MPDNIDTIDLTGSDPEFKRVDKRFMVFQSTQTLDFEEPAYASTVKVYRLAEGQEPVLLLENTDWAHRNSLQATNAISEAKLRDSTFQANLVTGIVMTGTVIPGNEYQVSVEYQGFYREATSYPSGAIGPNATPALMLSILETLDFLKNVKDPVSEVNSETLASVQILDEDYTGLNENNHIFNEEHQVNVPNNVYVIRPANGSFYKHDLVLTYNGINLIENRDYIVRGVNHGKTRISSHKSGVYEYIILTSPIVGTIQVDYRAFGGEITSNDFYNLRDGLIELTQLLESGQFVTIDNLPKQPIIIEILNRLAIVEEAVRHYAQVSFTYAIRTFMYNNMVYNDTNWVDIASVAHGPWSQMNPIASIGTGYFRITLPVFDYDADFTLNYNLTSGKLSISESAVHSSTYQSNGLDHFATRVVPKFRIVYDKEDINHGMILQMSVNGMTAGDTEVVFYDKTGSSTIWDLIDTKGSAHPNTEFETTLPDGTTWSSKNDSSAVTEEVSLIGDGYTAWAGSIRAVDIEEQSYREGEVYTAVDNTWHVDDTANKDELLQVEQEGVILTDVIGNNDIDVKQVKGVRVRLFDRYLQQDVDESSTQVISRTEGAESKVEPIVMYYIHDLCSLHCILKQTKQNIAANGSTRVLSSYTLTVKTKSGTSSLINQRFDLKQIDLLV